MAAGGCACITSYKADVNTLTKNKNGSKTKMAFVFYTHSYVLDSNNDTVYLDLDHHDDRDILSSKMDFMEQWHDTNCNAIKQWSLPAYCDHECVVIARES
jgi:hypothetical protein